MELMTACTRRDKSSSRPATCATAYGTKEVIGRALGCVKPNRGDRRTDDIAETTEESVQTTHSDSASDSLLHEEVNNKPKQYLSVQL